MNTDESELALFRAERRVREIQAKLHRWADHDPQRDLLERPLPGNGHGGCGRRLGETHRRKHRRGAPADLAAPQPTPRGRTRRRQGRQTRPDHHRTQTTRRLKDQGSAGTGTTGTAKSGRTPARPAVGDTACRPIPKRANAAHSVATADACSAASSRPAASRSSRASSSASRPSRKLGLAGQRQGVHHELQRRNLAEPTGELHQRRAPDLAIRVGVGRQQAVAKRVHQWCRRRAGCRSVGRCPAPITVVSPSTQPKKSLHPSAIASLCGCWSAVLLPTPPTRRLVRPWAYSWKTIVASLAVGRFVRVTWPSRSTAPSPSTGVDIEAVSGIAPGKHRTSTASLPMPPRPKASVWKLPAASVNPSKASSALPANLGRGCARPGTIRGWP